jgi:hypothetical protein
VWNPDPTAPRRFFLIAVGLPRTGTTSLAALFSGYRAAHEFQLSDTVEALWARHTGEASEADLRAFARRRFADGNLEMDAAGFHATWVETLMAEAPDARFVLQIREPRAWINSWLGLLSGTVRQWWGPGRPTWPERFFRLLFRAFDPSDYTSQERLVAALPRLLDPMLACWAQSRRWARALPADRTLVVRTEDLSSSLPALAAHAGVDVRSLDASCHHAHRGVGVDWLARMDPALVEDRLGQWQAEGTRG